MKVTVIGTGFVGVVTAGVLSSFGNEVVGLDIDEKKVASLNSGKVPFFEPGLEELLQQELANKHLTFTTSYQDAITNSDVILVAVGTPSAPDGNADLTYVKKAIEALAPYAKDGVVVCVKSTVPPGTLEKLEPLLNGKTQGKYVLASLPEFLREGSAVTDTLHPDRVVIGCLDPDAKKVLQELHLPFDAPILFVSPESAQMGKYSANAYLATRITFINQIADLCEKNGADVQEVIEIIGHDKRIGTHYWYPGLGYGGSCFPKDVRELAAYSRSVGLSGNLFNKIDELNEDRIFEKIGDLEQIIGSWSEKTVAVLGLSFKPFTDDMREAPSTKVIPHLLNQGATVQAYDPMAMEVAHHILGENPKLRLADSVEAALENADIVLALIEWPEVTQFDYSAWLRKSGKNSLIFFDARNQLNPDTLTESGWLYFGIGRRKKTA